MKISRCKQCKGFYPIPETWVSLILCAECNVSNKKYVGRKVVAVPGKSLLADPVTLDVDLTKPHRNPLRGFA